MFCSSKKTKSGGRNRGKWLGNFPLVYLKFALNDEKAVLRYCSREVFEPIQIVSELRENRKHRNEAVGEMRIHREDGTMFPPSTASLE